MIKQKVIESCPNYAITDDGKVWSFKSNKFLKQKIDKYGYACVSLRRNGKNWTVTVHRLVAEAFIPNPDNKPTVNHKDENKLNNSVTNLEWMTVNENNNYGTDELVIVAVDFSQSHSSAKINLPQEFFRYWQIPYGKLDPYTQLEVSFNKYGVAILKFYNLSGN